MIIKANFSYSEINVKVVQNIRGRSVVREIVKGAGAIVACSISAVVIVLRYLIFVIAVDVIDDILVVEPLKILFFVDEAHIVEDLGPEFS